VGRDRYCTRFKKISQAAIDNEPELPLTRRSETTVLRKQPFPMRSWLEDIDLDGRSSNYSHLQQFLLLAGGLKLREGFHRKALKQITITKRLHPTVG